MKKLTIIFAIQLMAVTSYCQAVITKPTNAASVKNIMLDFGAVGDGIADDTWAFIKAGKYFSNLWDINGTPLTGGAVNFDYTIYSAKLEIPSGTYLVGKQILVPPGGISQTYGSIFGDPLGTAPVVVPNGNAYLYGFELIKLENPSNTIDEIIISGVGLTKPLIKYNDSLVIGHFDSTGNPFFVPPPDPNNYFNRSYVNIGDFVSTFGCRNISIYNLEIDGNNTPVWAGGVTNYDGGYTGHGIQLGASGIRLTNTQNISLANLDIHHMTLDGLVLHDFYQDPAIITGQPLTNCSIADVDCDYNRRQGFSWVGGRNINVTDSKFNNTGTTVSGLAAGNPAAGIDIEPEADHSNNLLWCMDATFTDCESVNNVGNALGNDITAGRSKNIEFNNCKFHDVDNYAVWVKGKAFTFNDCKIWGSFIHGNDGSVAGEETIFNNCDFADEEVPGRPGVYNVGYALIESTSAKRTQFNNCSFRTLHASQKLATVQCPGTTENEFQIFSNCTFTISPSSNSYAIFYACIFDGDNSFTNLNTGSGYEDIFLNGIIFTGSNDPCNSNDFTSTGKINFTAALTNGNGLPQFLIGRNGIGTAATDGFASVNIKTNSCLYLFLNQVVDIGENSMFVNHNGGQIVTLSGTWNNDGKIILDNGSHTNFVIPITINSSATTNPEFYYHKNALMGLNTFWSGPFAGYIAYPVSSLALSPNTRFDGGNTAVPSGYESSLNDAILMDGTNDYVEIVNPSSLSKLSTYALSNNFSIEIAFKKDNNSRSEVLFSHGPDFNIAFKLGQLIYTLPLVGSGSYSELTSAMIDNTCHFLTLTRESDNYIRVYLDGSLIHTSSQSYTANISNANDIYIGRGITLTPAPLQGWVGRLRIWDRALTTADICYNHQFKTPFSTTNLIADWDMRDASGTTVTDAISTTINGTLMNGAAWVTQNTVGDCTEASFQNNFTDNQPGTKPGMAHLTDSNDRDLSISPNPGNGSFMLTVSGMQPGNFTVEIYDINGKLLFTQSGHLTGKIYQKQFHLKLPAAVYVLMLKNMETFQIKRLIIR